MEIKLRDFVKQKYTDGNSHILVGREWILGQFLIFCVSVQGAAVHSRGGLGHQGGAGVEP